MKRITANRTNMAILRKRLLVEFVKSTGLFADFLELFFSNSLRTNIQGNIWEGI